MTRLRRLIVLAIAAGSLLGLTGLAAPAQARPEGFMTCKLLVLDENYDPIASHGRLIECYY